MGLKGSGCRFEVVLAAKSPMLEASNESGWGQRPSEIERLMGFYKDRVVVITGANRGIGLALTSHLLAEDAYVYAGVRQPDKAFELQALGQKFDRRLHIAALDVQVSSSIASFIKPFTSAPLDILINNAGVNLDHGRSMKELPAEVLAQTFDANTLGPYRMLQALMPALHRAGQPVVANISSIMGSIAENESGGAVAYRVSKTATNMLTKCLAIEDKKIIALSLHPGWVKTRMGGDNAHIDVDMSASGLLDVISHAKSTDSGSYFRYSGEEISW